MGLVLGHNQFHGVSSTSSHGHLHGKRKLSSTPSMKNNEEEKNMNVQATFVHVIGHLLQSLGVLVPAIIIKFKVITTSLVPFL